MKKYMELLKNRKIHFVGIGGISMSSLALYMRDSGFSVSGSDIKQSEITEKLKKYGVKVTYSHKKENVYEKDAVIYSSAIDSLNPEMIYAKQHGVAVIKRSQLLGCIVKSYKYSVSVSGSHGKTTTTSMIADIFINAKKDPTVFLGGECKSFGNYRRGKETVIVEACEYKKNFLDIDASLKVILNIDNDHLDSYNGIEDEVETFSAFMENGVALVNKDDDRLEKIMNCSSFGFGIEKSAEFMAKRLKNDDGCYSFDAYAYNRKVGRIKLKVKGKHNVYNALASFAVGYVNKIPFDVIKKSLESFEGVKRRNENIGKFNGLNCIADYAHHPSEITATLNSVATEKTVVVFQPHTYSRTKYLMQDFIKSLDRAGELIIYKTYPAREEYDKTGSAKRLYEKIKENGKKNCYYADNEEELEGLITELSGDNSGVLFLGAGDVYDVAKKIIKKNKKI